MVLKDRERKATGGHGNDLGGGSVEIRAVQCEAGGGGLPGQAEAKVGNHFDGCSASRIVSRLGRTRKADRRRPTTKWLAR
mmetsp:Transcript_141830/g.353545  ORF Transcript_141830/g.353545 Transcript_141830/m.353545 type:complete len:80 (+) Transcript_141830:357-596(+)